jgi:hypothetical protein
MSAEPFNQDIGNWDVNNVINMQWMFWLAEALNHDIGNSDLSNAYNMTQMFSYSNLSTENYAAILSGGHTLNLISLVELDAAGINYCNGEQARQLIIDNLGWNIFDPDLDCTLGIEDIKSYSVFIYPNPTRSILYIRVNQYLINISI